MMVQNKKHSLCLTRKAAWLESVSPLIRWGSVLVSGAFSGCCYRCRGFSVDGVAEGAIFKFSNGSFPSEHFLDHAGQVLGKSSLADPIVLVGEGSWSSPVPLLCEKASRC